MPRAKLRISVPYLIRPYPRDDLLIDLNCPFVVRSNKLVCLDDPKRPNSIATALEIEGLVLSAVDVNELTWF